MSIVAVMDGLEVRLKTIAGLRVSDVKPGQINPPQAVIGIPPVDEYYAAFKRGTMVVAPTITVLTSATVDRIGQRALAGYADPSGDLSIVAAIMAEPTLGGACDDCIVTSFRPLGMEEVGLIGYFGGIFTLTVYGSGIGQ
jgi:hypothetical protein